MNAGTMRTQAVSPADEAELRHQLSDALRLAASLDLHEGICNHFSATVGDGRHLINPFGVIWDDMAPELLLVIDDTGTVIDGDGVVEESAAVIHAAGHRQHPEHRAIFHTHMPYATAITMIDGGRLEPAHQTALRFWGRTRYQGPFNGLALDDAEGERLAESTRPADAITFLENHGVVVTAPSIAVAFDDLYYLERAAQQQVLAQSTGLPLRVIPDDVAEMTANQFRDLGDTAAVAHFAARRRQLPVGPLA